MEGREKERDEREEEKKGINERGREKMGKRESMVNGVKNGKKEE